MEIYMPRQLYSRKQQVAMIQKVIDHLDHLETGLCLLIAKMLDDRFITKEEFFWLSDMLDDNEPEERKFFLYYFPPGLIQPRLVFLKQIQRKIKYGEG